MENLEQELTEQETVRRNKLSKYKELGVDPFGHRYDRDSWSQDIKDKYTGLTHEEMEEKNVTVKVAGRIMTLRNMGKVAFMHIQDKKGKIQVYLRKDALSETDWAIFKLADIGDIVGIEGSLMVTKTGELSVRASKYTHLSKALRPLPEKFHGLQDKEEARRRRYVDLIMNEDSKRIAFARPRIIRDIQRYMDDHGFVEVETPVLDPILGGASARPFVTHHNALDMDFYLRIATELKLKRLLVGGMENVYEIGRIFRNEGMDATHNPEFTTIEAYQAYGNLDTMMDLAEGIFKTCAQDIRGTLVFDYQGHTLDLSKPFRRLHMVDAIKEKTGIDFFKVTSDEEAIKLANEHGIELADHEKTYGHIINAFFEKYVEETLIQPTFLYGHPIEISPLTKKNPDDPRFTDRFELYINAKEFANAYTELNDPIDQKERFINQLKERELGNDEANDIDYDFLESLEYGMPPAGGIGIGIDRLVMLMTDTDSIRDVLLFPHNRPTSGTENRAINTLKETPVVTTPVTETKIEEPIDFSNVEIEPLFTDFVDFDTFSKSDFRAVKVKECEAVAKSKKLLKFVLDDGTGTDRIILSGIHAEYEPEELVGKTLLAIVNLPPRKMMGIDSCGMILSAIHNVNGEEKLNVIMLDDHIPAGAKLY